jgi:hypothetical protein
VTAGGFEQAARLRRHRRQQARQFDPGDALGTGDRLETRQVEVALEQAAQVVGRLDAQLPGDGALLLLVAAFAAGGRCRQRQGRGC